MKRVELHDEAELELFEAASYFEEQRPGDGDRFLDAVRREWEWLLVFPKIGRSSGRTIRKRRVPDFRYTIIYRLIEDGIFIVAIAHHARRPGYWRERLR